jgi:hypothetical protein
MVTLEPYSTYYIVSQEFNGGDRWYYDNVLVTTSAATINSPAYVSGPNTYTRPLCSIPT